MQEGLEMVRRLAVATRSGRVSVSAVAGAVLQVRGGRVDDNSGGTLSVRADRPSSKVEITCPEGCDVVVGTSSGSVDLHGQLGDVRVTTSSGRIALERATRADLRTHSGVIEVGVCEGTCRIVTGSARVTVGRAGSAEISARSGAVSAGRVDSGCVHTASGRVEVGTSSDGRVEVRTISGSVRVKVPREMRPMAMLSSRSGSIRCDCEQGGDGRIEVSTTSGTIRVECE